VSVFPIVTFGRFSAFFLFASLLVSPAWSKGSFHEDFSRQTLSLSALFQPSPMGPGVHPRTQTLAALAADLLRQNYTLNPEKAGHLANLMAQGEVIESNGQMSVVAFGKRLMSQSLLGTRRFFDENGRWVLTLTPGGKVWDELMWTNTGGFMRARTYNPVLGTLRLSNQENAELKQANQWFQTTRPTRMVRSVQNEQGHPLMDFSPGIDFENTGLIPYGTISRFSLDRGGIQRQLTGVGSAVFRLIAILAGDQKHTLTYRGDDTYSEENAIRDARPHLINSLWEIADPVNTKDVSQPQTASRFRHLSNAFWQPGELDVIEGPDSSWLYFKDGQLIRAYYDGAFYLSDEHLSRGIYAEDIRWKTRMVTLYGGNLIFWDPSREPRQFPMRRPSTWRIPQTIDLSKQIVLLSFYVDVGRMITAWSLSAARNGADRALENNFTLPGYYQLLFPWSVFEEMLSLFFLGEFVPRNELASRYDQLRRQEPDMIHHLSLFASVAFVIAEKTVREAAEHPFDFGTFYAAFTQHVQTVRQKGFDELLLGRTLRVLHTDWSTPRPLSTSA